MDEKTIWQWQWRHWASLPACQSQGQVRWRSPNLRSRLFIWRPCQHTLIVWRKDNPEFVWQIKIWLPEPSFRKLMKILPFYTLEFSKVVYWLSGCCFFLQQKFRACQWCVWLSLEASHHAQVSPNYDCCMLNVLVFIISCLPNRSWKSNKTMITPSKDQEDTVQSNEDGLASVSPPPSGIHNISSLCGSSSPHRPSIWCTESDPCCRPIRACLASIDALFSKEPNLP